MKVLNADIKNNDFKPAYLICGDESFLVGSYKRRMRNAIAPQGDMNATSYEGKDIDANEIADAAQTMPFFAEKKLIMLEDTGWFKGSAPEAMLKYFDEINPTTVIIFIESEVDKRNKLYKKVSENGYVAELNHPKPEELVKWAAGILAQSGKKITRTDMENFLNSTGNDMELIKNELDKLIAYTGERDVVTGADIEAVTTVTLTNKVYDMCRAITQKKQTEAMRLYEDLLALHEAPMSIMYKISRQFNQLLIVKDLMLNGYNKDSVASELRITSYIAGKLIQQVRDYDRGMLISYVERCVELEEAFKKGDMPERLAVELLICG